MNNNIQPKKSIWKWFRWVLLSIGIIIIGLGFSLYFFYIIYMRMDSQMLQKAHEALSLGITIEDEQNDFVSVRDKNEKEGDNLNNLDGYKYPFLDLKSVSVGIDDRYLYWKVQFRGEIPNRPHKINGDKIVAQGVGISIVNKYGEEQVGLAMNCDFLPIVDIPTIGTYYFYGPTGIEEPEDKRFAHQGIDSKISGGGGTDYLIGALPLKKIDIISGQDVYFSVSVETGSAKDDHFAVDVLKGEKKDPAVIKWKSGTKVYEIVDIGYTKESMNKYPSCPENLSGILTAPLMNPDDIGYLMPLGSFNPPGHTEPIDHIWFETNETLRDKKDKIPLYAPADSVIIHLSESLVMNSEGKYVSAGYTLKYVICDGVELDLTEYTELTEEFKEKIPKSPSDCKYGLNKSGHGAIEGVCSYDIEEGIPVKSGEHIGWTEVDERGVLLFEVWAADYNKEPRKDVDWDYYNDNRYAHAICLFDLYSGELKEKYYSKFGGFLVNLEPNSTVRAFFARRTIEPICGQTNQDIVGTIQGLWFSKEKNMANLEDRGMAIGFIHNSVDPRRCDITIQGNIMDPGVIEFIPLHSGKINREFSEVKADGNIYCYDVTGAWADRDALDKYTGKILVQLIDDRHLKVEHQKGSCSENEIFVKPFIYQR